MTLFWVFLIALVLWLLPDGKSSSNDGTNYSGNEIIFTAKFTRGGNLIYPERLIFDNYNVSLRSNNGINSLYTTTGSQMIPNNKITGYKISRYLIGCDITIIGEGYQNILAIGYTGDDSNKIERILKSLINK